ncbi:hypothetical protein E1301_Tti011126 [Triplophysa tibetana]|uniref:Uncharacterized protein n=1 Tax=Triplophysa tibetana TaxID=1572043 RepID=A0A5A9NMT4_9TELE|nr:hypothetical protein E1301_Tti011126 [Triplophysa tibetana]
MATTTACTGFTVLRPISEIIDLPLDQVTVTLTQIYVSVLSNDRQHIWSRILHPASYVQINNVAQAHQLSVLRLPELEPAHESWATAEEDLADPV